MWDFLVLRGPHFLEDIPSFLDLSDMIATANGGKHMSKKRLSDQEVWETVEAAAREQYQEYLDLNQLSDLAVLPKDEEPRDMERNFDVPTDLVVIA